MREIEIKSRVLDKNQTLAALEKNGVKFGKPNKQHDIVYSRPGARGNDPNETWLRVRVENDNKVLFTFKRSVTSELDSIEHEVVVDNANELTAIIRCMGYELFSDLTKTRRKATYGDIEICFDEVAQLGIFIEAEKLCEESEDVAAVTKELWHLFAKLGIDRASEEIHGYDVLLHIQAGTARLT